MDTQESYIFTESSFDEEEEAQSDSDASDDSNQQSRQEEIQTLIKRRATIIMSPAEPMTPVSEEQNEEVQQLDNMISELESVMMRQAEAKRIKEQKRQMRI